jgi:hypothetical protein
MTPSVRPASDGTVSDNHRRPLGRHRTASRTPSRRRGEIFTSVTGSSSRRSPAAVNGLPEKEYAPLIEAPDAADQPGPAWLS